MREEGFLLLRAFKGLPMNNALIKFLSEEGNNHCFSDENFYMQNNNKEMPKVTMSFISLLMKSKLH
jgi:preprotein translocase subunit SecA